MNQIAHDYKYTDRDVREDPRLTELAEAYLRSYGGEFEPLIEAKTYLRVVGPLPTAMVRKTLNCMRQDNNVAGQMPMPQRAFTIEDFLVPNESVRPPVETGRIYLGKEPYPIPYVERNARRAPFDLKTRWNKDYYAATAKRATAFHYLDKELSTIRYYPEVGEYQPLIRSMCGVHLATGVLLDAPPAARHECKQCTVMIEERARRQAEREIIEHNLREEQARG